MSASKKIVVTGKKLDSNNKTYNEVVLFLIERTLDGVVMKIMKPDRSEPVEVILLPFSDSVRLGKLLISEAHAGIVQMELLLRKLADIEYEIRRMDNKYMEELKRLDIKINELAEIIRKISEKREQRT